VAPVGTTLEEAERILHQNRIEKLLVVDEKLPAPGPHHVKGHPEADPLSRACKDHLGRLRWAPRLAWDRKISIAWMSWFAAGVT